MKKGFRLEELDICIEDVSTVKEFWHKMQQYDLAEKIFFDGIITDSTQLFVFWRASWVYIGYHDDKMVGAIWFNDFSPEGCNIHICSFPGYSGKEAEAHIRSLLQRVLDNSKNNAYTIRGLTPYKGVLRHFTNFGFVSKGKVDKVIESPYFGEISLYLTELKK